MLLGDSVLLSILGPVSDELLEIVEYIHIFSEGLKENGTALPNHRPITLNS